MVIISRLFSLSLKLIVHIVEWGWVQMIQKPNKWVVYPIMLQSTVAQPERCSWRKQMGCSDSHSVWCLLMRSPQFRSALLCVSRHLTSHIHTSHARAHTYTHVTKYLSCARHYTIRVEVQWYEKRHSSCPPRASTLLEMIHINQTITSTNIQTVTSTMKGKNRVFWESTMEVFVLENNEDFPE